jgi:hypothetical protein
MDVAERVADAYDDNDRLAALAVAGSVATGLADRWSDLELDCYWSTSPTDLDRLAPIERLGGVVDGFWPYDAKDAEWSENYTVGDLPVTISNFTVATVDQFLDAVTGEANTAQVKHMRLAALRCCRPLRGAGAVRTWQARAACYPDRLLDAIVESALDPAILAGWSARDALAERGDDIAVHALLSQIVQASLAAIEALNKVYRPHRVTKWQRHLIAGLDLAPTAFEERLRSVWRMPYGEAFDTAEALLSDTIGLAEQHSRADLTAFREAVVERRTPVSRAR